MVSETEERSVDSLGSDHKDANWFTTSVADCCWSPFLNTVAIISFCYPHLPQISLLQWLTQGQGPGKHFMTTRRLEREILLAGSTVRHYCSLASRLRQVRFSLGMWCWLMTSFLKAVSSSLRWHQQYPPLWLNSKMILQQLAQVRKTELPLEW